eukprot:c5813_g1_i1.p1 GENE.c5813_g1_i1~~c5813_g1_i1.p1  ORF type:complete len:163 (-),score=32.37 c5813_g1_i1:77-532(-)
MSETSNPEPAGASAPKPKKSGKPSQPKVPSTSAVTESLLGRQRLNDLLHEISPNETMEPEVETALLAIADEFVDNVTTFACRLAKHRGSTQLEAKDIRLHLEKNWDLRVPGFVHPDDVRTKRKPANDAHKHRLDLAKKVSSGEAPTKRART